MVSSCAQETSSDASQLKMPWNTAATVVRPWAVAHLATSIDRPVPYRWMTAKKMSRVAAAIRVAISHSSKWSSRRDSTARIPQNCRGQERACSRPPAFTLLASVALLHADVQVLLEQVEDLLADPPPRH